MSKREPLHTYLHIDPENVIFAVTESDLIQLENGGATMWRDVFWFSCPLSLSCLLNGCARYYDKGVFDRVAYMNIVVAIAFLSFALSSAIAWYQFNKLRKNIANEIRNRPRTKILLCDISSEKP
jgi:hypothetical protein